MPQTLTDVRGNAFGEPHLDGVGALADKRAEAILETPGEGVVGYHHRSDARERHLLDPIDAKHPQIPRRIVVRIQIQRTSFEEELIRVDFMAPEGILVVMLIR